MINIEYPDGLSREEWLSLIEQRRNPFYRYPENTNVPIWRYVDFAKFVNLIDSSSLFLPNATLLEDSFEGAISKVNIQSEIQRHETFIKDLGAYHGEQWTSIDSSQVSQQLAGHRAIRSAHAKWARQWTYISCWHVNELESAAMWELYGVKQNAIALVSTFNCLRCSLEPHKIPPSGDPIIGLINYIDYESQPVSQGVYLSEYFYKRKSFEHERELRAIIQELPTTPLLGSANSQYDLSRIPAPGKALQIDLNDLIKFVYVAPKAPDWFFQLVQNVSVKYGLTCEVRRSRLDAVPIY